MRKVFHCCKTWQLLKYLLSQSQGVQYLSMNSLSKLIDKVASWALTLQVLAPWGCGLGGGHGNLFTRCCVAIKWHAIKTKVNKQLRATQKSIMDASRKHSCCSVCNHRQQHHPMPQSQPQATFSILPLPGDLATWCPGAEIANAAVWKPKAEVIFLRHARVCVNVAHSMC